MARWEKRPVLHRARTVRYETGRYEPKTLTPCSPEQYVGFVAEDVPDLVATNDRKGLSALDLVAVLTKVVQHQQAQIEIQNRDMESLRGDVERIKAGR